MDHLVDQGVKALVIACNSASAAVLRDARERYDVPVVEVIQPAVRRAVRRDPQRAGSASSAPGHRHERGLRGRVRRGARTSSSPAACPRSSSSSRPASPAARSCSGSPTSTSTRWSRAGRRHPRPRLHALPAARRRHLLRDGGGRHARVAAPTRPPRTSTARSSRTASSARPRPARPVHRFLATGDPSRSPGWGGGSSARRSARRARRGRSCPMRLTVVGCAGSYPGPDSPASCYLVEHDGPPASCSTSATARSARCSATPTPYALDAVVLSHLHADHCLDLTSYYVARRYHPDGPPPGAPVLGPPAPPTGWPAYDLPPRGGDARRVRLPRPRRGRPRSARSASRWRRVNHPVEAYAIRVEAGAGRWSTAATPAPRRWSSSPAAPTSPVRGVVPRARRQPRGPAPHRPRPAEHAMPGRRRARAHPPRAVERRGRTLAEAAAAYDGDRAGPAGARDLELTSVRCPRVARMTRSDGRAPTSSVPSPSSAAGSTTPRARVLVEFGRTRCCAPRRSPRACRAGARAPGSAGSPPSTRCCRAPPTPAATASRCGQGRRAHPRDLPAGRPLAARGHRPGGAGREHDRPRLRRAAGRRRHPHRGHHRRLRRARRRVEWARGQGLLKAGAPAAHRLGRGRSASASSTASPCSTCTTTTTSRPRPT
jgi:ribonuclease BN (tRNA processing enzyme)